MSKTDHKDNSGQSRPLVEAFSVLRSNLKFYNLSREIKTLTITSCNPGDGKTTTAVNLSVSMAKAGYKVLFVDADIRKPKAIHDIGGKNEFGLTDLICDYTSMEKAITSTLIENFKYISSGFLAPNPSELLGSIKFTELLNTFKQIFDMVIIDTPPLGSVIDSALIASQTDGTLLVIKSKAVKLRNALIVREQLEKANAKIVGVVINKVEKSYYKNYYSYYDYYDKVPKSQK